MKIIENVETENKFLFEDIISEEIESELRTIDPKKAGMKDNIPAKPLKMSSDIVGKNLSTMYNNSKNNEKFPITLKVADVTPIHKAKERII